MSLFVYLLQLFIPAYIIYIYLYLIRFFNWNIAGMLILCRICQEVASPFSLFFGFDCGSFPLGPKMSGSQTVGGLTRYSYVCATRLSVVKCLLGLIGKVKGE